MSSGNTNNNYGCGIGFFGALTLIFVVAKIAGFLEWPWILVLSPVIVGVCARVILVIVFILVAALMKHD